jgi:hypothetical protein
MKKHECVWAKINCPLMMDIDYIDFKTDRENLKILASFCRSCPIVRMIKFSQEELRELSS